MSKRNRYVSRAIPLIILALVLLIGAGAFTPLAQRAQRFSYIITKKLLVLNDTELRGDFAQAGDNTITGDLTVTGDTVLGDSATADTLTVTGNTAISGARDATTGYDYFLAIDGEATGTLSGAKTYGLYIDMERTAANASGNIDEAGAKIRYKTSATSRVAGIVANGMDVEAKTDDDHHAGTLRGAQITAVGDAGSTTDNVIGLRVHAEMSGDATDLLQIADFELNRKDATEPTAEYGINVRNTSSVGTGADVGYRLETSAGAGGSSANADWTYGLDFNPATITTAEIRFTNEETIDNLDDGTIDITGILGVSDDIHLENDETIGNDADGTITMGGMVHISGVRDATSGYDYMLRVDGDATGTEAGAKTYGIYVDVERTANSAHGNIDDAGIKVRYKTSAASRTAGIVEAGGDFEGKVDDGHAAGTIRGAVATAVLDSTATADAQVAFRAHAELGTGATATAVTVGDFELNRKSVNEPTTEYGITLRNTSSVGTGADVGFRLESSFGAGGATANADWGYGLDMNDADIVTADIRLSNGETIDNVTDTAIVIGGFIAADIGATVDITTNDTITAVATWQTLTVDGSGPATTDGTTAIDDGPIEGALLILVNEDAEDIVIKDGANTKLSGDTTLTGGAQDVLTLIWDGSDWVGVSFIDN